MQGMSDLKDFNEIQKGRVDYANLAALRDLCDAALQSLHATDGLAKDYMDAVALAKEYDANSSRYVLRDEPRETAQNVLVNYYRKQTDRSNRFLDLLQKFNIFDAFKQAYATKSNPAKVRSTTYTVEWSIRPSYAGYIEINSNDVPAFAANNRLLRIFPLSLSNGDSYFLLAGRGDQTSETGEQETIYDYCIVVQHNSVDDNLNTVVADHKLSLVSGLDGLLEVKPVDTHLLPPYLIGSGFMKADFTTRLNWNQLLMNEFGLSQERASEVLAAIVDKQLLVTTGSVSGVLSYFGDHDALRGTALPDSYEGETVYENKSTVDETPIEQVVPTEAYDGKEVLDALKDFF